MFNYQSELYVQLMDKWQHLNLTKEEMYHRFTEISQHINHQFNTTSQTIREHVPQFVQESPILQEIHSDWVKFYKEAYDWVHPRLLELSNTTLHYGTGVSVGVLASLLILVFILSKFVPSRLKSLMYLLLVVSTSASMYVVTQLNKYFSEPVTETFMENWQYFVGYIVIVGLISFAIVYRYGPVEDERTLTLIQWFMQGVGLCLVFYSTQSTEVSVALVVLLLAIYNFPKAVFTNQTSKNLWYRFFPPKVKLLTEDEYIRQGNESTKLELEKLRDYCRSPDCQTWKVISKLQNPHRFAEFISSGLWHITSQEMSFHDAVYDPPADTDRFSDADSDTESELVFVLGNPNMTVRL